MGLAFPPPASQSVFFLPHSHLALLEFLSSCGRIFTTTQFISYTEKYSACKQFSYNTYTTCTRQLSYWLKSCPSLGQIRAQKAGFPGKFWPQFSCTWTNVCLSYIQQYEWIKAAPLRARTCTWPDVLSSYPKVLNQQRKRLFSGCAIRISRFICKWYFLKEIVNMGKLASTGVTKKELFIAINTILKRG